MILIAVGHWRARRAQIRLPDRFTVYENMNDRIVRSGLVTWVVAWLAVIAWWLR